MKKTLWFGAVISIVFPGAVVLGYAFSHGSIGDPDERGPILMQLLFAYLPFLQLMAFLLIRRKLTDPARISGATAAAFVVFAWNALLWSVPGSAGPGSGANIGFGMLMMVQWTLTYPALLLVEKIAVKIARRGGKDGKGQPPS